MKKIIATALLILAPVTATAQQNSLECETLWYERNAIFSEGGLCYRSTLGQSLFDNSNCTLQRGGDVFLTQEQRQRISNILTQERALSCSINTSQPPSSALRDLILQESSAPETTLAQEEQNPLQAFVTCSDAPINAWQTPKAETLIAVLSSQEPVQTPPSDPNWHQILIEKPGWEPQTAWIPVTAVAQNCPHSNQHSPIILANHAITEALTPPALNTASMSDQADTSTGRANTLWTNFAWSHQGCGILPSLSLKIEEMRKIRTDIQRYRTCLSEQAQKDEIDYIVAITELGGKTIETERLDAQTIFPWDCLTCQAHQHSLEQSKEQRARWRRDTNTLLDDMDQTVRTWLDIQ